MPEVEAPVVGTKVDSSDLGGSAKSLITGIIGVGLLTVVLNYGRELGEFTTERVDDATGGRTNAEGGVSRFGSPE